MSDTLGRLLPGLISDLPLGVDKSLATSDVMSPSLRDSSLS